MRETGPKVTAGSDKITIAFDKKIRLGPLHTVIEAYLQLTREQQKQIEDLMESFLFKNENSGIISQEIDSLTILSLNDLKTKKEKILGIVRNRANPNYLTAREVEELYRHYVDDDISISTVQTNLNRLADEGLIEKQDGDPIEYRINPQMEKEIPKVLI